MSSEESQRGRAAAEDPWYEAAFGADYVEVYPHRDLAAARSEIGGLVARGLSGRVLDLGCGFGRHSLAMHEHGLDVFGLDLSWDLLTHATQVDDGGALRGRLVRGDFRHLPFADGTFDAVVMLFSSFGYFDEGENGRVLAEVARLLRPGALAVFDLMNPTLIRARLVPESQREAAGRVFTERRRLADGSRRVQKDVHVREPDGSESRWREDVRLFDPDEFQELLSQHGLGHLRVEGDFDGSELGEASPRQLVWARR